MRILGIDTSSKFLSIALSDGKKIISENSFLLERAHSSLLVPKIKEVLEESRVSPKDVEGFIVGLGPGSFTGLRIGVSTVKGFGIASKKPCAGVPSIDAIALNAPREHRLIVPVIDAKRNNVYAAIYERKKDRILRKTDYLLSDILSLMKEVKGEALFLGDGLGIYRKNIEELNKKAVFLEEDHWYPKAGNLIKLGLKKISRQKRPGLEKLKILYLYPRDCQVKLKKTS